MNIWSFKVQADQKQQFYTFLLLLTAITMLVRGNALFNLSALLRPTAAWNSTKILHSISLVHIYVQSMFLRARV